MDRISNVTADLAMRDVMTSTSTVLSSETPLAKACALMQSVRAEALPVVDNGWPVGIVFVRDAARGAGAARVADAMSASIYVTDADANLRGTADAIIDESYDAAVVYDGTRLVGIFTAAEAIRAVAALRPRERVVAAEPSRKAA